MLRRLLFTIAALVAAFAVLLPALRSFTTSKSPSSTETIPTQRVPGRNNTVLFLSDSHSGFGNIHLATVSALIEKHPDIKIHFASYPKIKTEIKRVSAAAQRKRLQNGAGGSSSKKSQAGTRKSSQAAAQGVEEQYNDIVEWHTLPGLDIVTASMREWESTQNLIEPPGIKGIAGLTMVMRAMLAPRSTEEEWALYEAVRDVIEEVDPALVVLDSMVRQGTDAVRMLNRSAVVMSPNGMTEVATAWQPWLKMLWKYPAMGSGYPFPLPWHLIPANTYLQARLIYGIVTNSRATDTRKFFASKGVADALVIDPIRYTDIPWLTMALPEANLPLDTTPPQVKYCGPIALDVGTVEEQDEEMIAWLRAGSARTAAASKGTDGETMAGTMLINLGSKTSYNEEQATALVEALVSVLETTETQVLWKFQKSAEYGDDYLAPAQKYIDNGRLRVTKWLTVDPLSLIKSGHISVLVHHGGASSYHEAVVAGIPHVILPLWADLYNFANTAEYLGIGIWPSRQTAPKWRADDLSRGFLSALTGPGAEQMRRKAKTLGEVAKAYGGRYTAAEVVADLARQKPAEASS